MQVRFVSDEVKVSLLSVESSLFHACGRRCTYRHSYTRRRTPVLTLYTLVTVNAAV